MWKNVARHGTEEKILMEDRHGREKNVSVNTDDLRVQADKRVTTIATIMQPPAPREKWFGTLFSVEAKLQVVTHRPIDLLGTCVTQYSCRVLQSQGAGPPGESGSLLLCRAPPPIPESGHWVLFPLTCRGEEIPPLNLAPHERASVCGIVRLGESACPVQEAAWSPCKGYCEIEGYTVQGINAVQLPLLPLGRENEEQIENVRGYTTAMTKLIPQAEDSSRQIR